MINKITDKSSELHNRMEVLHTKHYVWLLQASTNITKCRVEAEDLISDLYLYLFDKGNPSIYYKDSFNLMYAYRFLQTRWVNKINKKNKVNLGKYNEKLEVEDIPYDMESDIRMMEAYDSVEQELKRLSTTRDWPKSRLFEMYYGSEETMLEIADKIGICKSSMFTNVKRIREHLKSTIPNPFIVNE